jgi:hypothetical protein
MDGLISVKDLSTPTLIISQRGVESFYSKVM